MAFVNEFVSEEDVKKYDLDKIWDIYHPFSKGEPPLGFRYTWTIDKEKNIFLIPVASGREEYSNRVTCVLWWNGTRLTIKIDLAAESSSKLSDTPFKRIWELVEVCQRTDFSEPREKVISILKEALITYGYRGADRQISNTIVEFKL